MTEEACPLNLVPTASTTAALAIGDALAMTVSAEKGFKQEDFREPSSRRQAGQASDARRAPDARRQTVPHRVRRHAVCATSFYEMSSKGLGMTCVVDDAEKLLGIITDGDLRRQMERAANILELSASRGDDSRPSGHSADDARRSKH